LSWLANQRGPELIERAEVCLPRSIKIQCRHFRVIEPGCEPLFCAGIFRRRKRTANIAGNDLHICGAQLPERPDDVVRGEAPAFPIRDCFLGAETIQINGYVGLRPSQGVSELGELRPPI